MNGRIIRRRILRAQAFAALSAVLCCLPLVSSVHAGQKTYSGNIITDDLATGFGAGVGLTGFGVEVTGGFGQVMTMTAENTVMGSTRAESGYFSAIVDTPTAAEFYEVFYTSFSVAWIGVNNPDGTEYVVELSTAADFSALRSSGTFSVSPATLGGLASDTTYYTRIKAVYGDSDESAWLDIGSTRTVFNALPQAYITAPAHNSAVNSFVSIAGTAADDKAVAGVMVSVQRMSDLQYWDGSTDFIMPEQAWYSTTLTLPSWDYGPVGLGSALVNGSSYTIVAKAKDDFDEWSVVYSTSLFYYDTSSPNVAITEPPGGFINYMSVIQGTASDSIAVSTVQITILDQSAGKYWDGSGFNSTPAIWNGVAVYPTSWTYLPSIAWAAGTQYLLEAKAQDTAGNWSTFGSVSFTFDDILPYGFITDPRAGSYRGNLNFIKGTAIDSETAVSYVDVVITRNSDGKSWDGDSFESGSFYLNATYMGYEWEYPTSSIPWAPGETYSVSAMINDMAANMFPTPTVSFINAVPSGCDKAYFVHQGGLGDYAAIQPAVNGVSSSLGGNNCIVIKDTQTYSEQVTVQGKAVNGYRLKIMADPTFVSSAPAVNPPAGSFAAFQIFNDSVSVLGINVITTNTVNYGVYASSSSVDVSSVNVISGVYVVGAGIVVSSYSTISYSSVTAPNASGLWLQGNGNAVSYSTAAVASGGYALWLQGVASNTVDGSYFSNSSGYGAYIVSGSSFNTISQSTITNSSAGGALYISDSSSNTVAGSYIHNVSGTAAFLSANANSNTISNSTMTTTSGVYALLLSAASSNTITGSYVANPALYGARLEGNSNFNTISQSTFTCTSASFYALSLNGSSSNTITGSYFYSPASSALTISGANGNTVSLSTITSQAVSAAALYINASGTNTVTGSYIANPYSTAAFLTGGANNNTISQSTITSSGMFWPAVYFSAASSNTLSANYISNLSTGVYIVAGSSCTTISQSTVSVSAVGATAVYVNSASTNTISGSQITSSGGDGIRLENGTKFNTISGSTVTGTGENYCALYLNNSASNTITGSYLVNDTAGLASAVVYLVSNSSFNVISQSTITTASSQYYTMRLSNSSSNTITGSYINGPNTTSNLTLDNNSNNNIISYSTITNNIGGYNALYLSGVSSNTFTRSYIANLSGNAIYTSGASFNTISYSTMVSKGSSSFGLYFSASSSNNTITRSYVWAPYQTGLYMLTNSNFNTVSFSTITGGGSFYSIWLGGVSSNTFTGNFVSNTGSALYFAGGASYNAVSQSTITSSGAGKYGIDLYRSSVTTIADCYVQASTPVYVDGSTTTIIGGSVLVANNSAGVGLNIAKGSLGLFLATSTVSGGSLGSAVYISSNNTGKIELASNTITGGAYGLNIDTQAYGATLSISSMTFASLTSGATAINFLSGYFVSTFSAVAFNTADIAVNVNGDFLAAGSYIAMRDYGGVRGASSYERDVNNHVYWVDLASPTVAITAPIDGTYVNSLSLIAGTAADNEAVSTVTVSIQRVSDGWYWDAQNTSWYSLYLDTPAVIHPSSWTFTALPTWGADTYTIVAKANDASNNWSTVYATSTFTFDSATPGGAIVSPANNAYLNALTSISGTAFDTYGLSMASISVQEADSGLYYDPQTSTFNAVALTWIGANLAGTAPNYSWSVTAPDLQDSKSYSLTLTIVDLAGNVFTQGTPTTVHYDVSQPVIGIASPTAAAYIGPLAQITGTATDNMLVGQVQVAVQDRDSNLYWVGGGWVTPATWLDASIHPSSWTYAAPPMVDTNRYQISAKAGDSAGNWSSVYDTGIFTYDEFAPTTTVTMPAALAYYSMPEIKGGFTESVSGLNPADGIQIAIKRNDTSAFWDGSGWGTFSAFDWRNATAIYESSWTYTDTMLISEFSMLAGSAEFTVYARGKDIAGNKNTPDTPAPAGGVAFKIDFFKPVSITTYPALGGGATVYLTAPVDSIAGTASDADPGASSGLSNIYTRVRRYNSLGVECYLDPTLLGWSSDLGVEAWLPYDSGTPEMWTKAGLLQAFQGTNTGNCDAGADKGDGYRFLAQSYSKDNTEAVNGGPNTETAYSTATFVLDFSTPTAGIASPGHLTYFNSITSITGTALDPVTGGGIPSGLDTIEYELTDIDAVPSKYWNYGAGQWQIPYVSSAIPASADWTKTSLPNNNPTGDDSWAVGRSSASFAFRVKVYDRAGNYSDFGASYSTFTYDALPPGSAITYPPMDGLTFTSMTSITGTSFDAYSGISDVKIRMWYVAGGTSYFWHPSGLHWEASDPGWLANPGAAGPGATLNPWSYTNSDFTNPGSTAYAWKQATHDGLNGKTFFIVAKAIDAATNEEVNFSTRSFLFDNEGPVSAPTMPGVDTSYNAITTISGTVSEDTGTVASLKVSILSEDEAGGAKYFGGNAFDQTSEYWLNASEVYQSSWTFSNGLLVFNDQKHYLVKSSATDNAGNVQSVPGQSRFLYDTTEPTANFFYPATSAVYNDDDALIGTAADPGYTSGIDGAGSGVYPSLVWHRGKVETAVFRDTAPLMGSAGPLVYGFGTGWDDSGYFWNGSTWTDAAGGPVWVQAQFTDAAGNWQYSGLVCDNDTERTEQTCWIKGDSYASWVRVTDNAGNLQTTVNDGPKFYISAPANSFLITVDADPMTAGDIVNVTVEAKDGLNGAGNTAMGYVSTIDFHVDLPTDGPEYMGTTDPEAIDEIHGLPKEYKFVTGDYGVKQFQMRLRKSGNRTLNVSDKDNGSIYANKAVVVNASAADRVQVIADYDASGELPAPGTPAGSTGSPRTKAAGEGTAFLLQVTDQYWNLVVSSEALVYVTDTDPNNAGVDGYVSFTGSTTINRTFVTAGAGWNVSATGQGVEPNNRNPSSSVPVTPGAAIRLLTLLPGESFSGGTAPGKTGTPAIPAFVAGQALPVTVGVVDNYYNLVTGRAADVQILTPTDAYAPAVATAAVNIASGQTEPIYVNMRRAATHYLTALDYIGTGLFDDPESSTFTVLAAAPKGLQLLLPGETALPGSGTYPNGGKTGTASTQTAGTEFYATVNLVDPYMNVYQNLSAGPTVYLQTSDAYDMDGSSIVLNSGALQVPLTLVTKAAGAYVKAYPVDAADNYVCSGNVGNVCRNDDAAARMSIKVYASTATQLEVMLPGQTLVEGKCNISPPCASAAVPWPGRTGPPSQYIIGTGALTANVYLTDIFFNKVSEAVGAAQDTNPVPIMPEVEVRTPGDPLDTEPAPQTLANGAAVFSLGPLTKASEYNVHVETTAASLAGYQQAVSTLTVYSATPGCGYIAEVGKGGAAEYDDIQSALNSLPVTLSTTTCVVIRDTETYSEQVTVANFNNNGYRLKIMADPTFVSSAPTINPPASSTAAFRVMSDSVTLQGMQVVSTNTVPYGILASSADVAISSFMVDGAALINAAAISVTTRAAISNTMVFLNNAGRGLWLSGSSIAIADSYFSNISGISAWFDPAAGLSSVIRSTFTATTTGAAFYMGSSTNTIAESYIYNNSSFALYLGGAVNNTISRSTMTGAATAAAVYFGAGASSNTVSESVVTNPQGTAFYITNCGSNTVTRSSLYAGGDNYMALYLNHASSNTVTDSYLTSGNGNGVYLLDSDHTSIYRSTIASTDSGYYGYMMLRSSADIVSDSYLYGYFAAQIASSTGTAISNSVLVGTWTGGTGLKVSFGSVNFTLSSSTVFGGTQSSGIRLEAGNSGVTTLYNNTVMSGRVGLSLDVPAAGSTIFISSITFASLSAGATAINFLTGQYDIAIASPVFDSGDVNVNGELLTFGSRVIMEDAAGLKKGPMYETDPSDRVIWWDQMDGCDTGVNVYGGGGGDYTSAAAAVEALPGTLYGDTCVVLRDSVLFGEQVTVRNIKTNGYRLKVMSDPELVGPMPSFDPPAASTAAFVIEADSVSVTGIDIVPTSALPYGIMMSSDNVIVASVTVSGGTAINVAGVALSSYSTVTDSIVTVLSADGLTAPGAAHSTLVRSTFTNDSFGMYGMTLGYAESNTVEDCYISNNSGTGAYLNWSNFNQITGSTMASVASGAGLYMDFSSSNTFIGNRASGQGGYGIWLANSSDDNNLTQNIITSANGMYGLYLTNSDLNNMAGNSISNGGNHAAGISGGNANEFSGDILVGAGTGSRALNVVGGSSNAITGAYLAAAAGYGVYCGGGSYGNSVALSTITSNNAAYSAVYMQAASSNTFDQNYISNPPGYGFRLYGGADGNSVSQSTITTAGPSASVYISDAASATFTGSVITNTAGIAAYITGTAYENSFEQCDISGSTATRATIELDSTDWNYFTGSSIHNTLGEALYISASANNTVSQSTVTSGGAGQYAIRMSVASYNTVTASYIGNTSGYGALLSYSSNNQFNSSAIQAGPYTALNLTGSPFNTVQDSSLASDTRSLDVLGGSDQNTILRSTMTCSAGGAICVSLTGVSTTTISDSRITSSAGGAVRLNGGNYLTTIEDTVISANGGALAAVELLTSSFTRISGSMVSNPSYYGLLTTGENDTVIRSTVTGSSSYAGIYVNNASTGAIYDSYAQGYPAVLVDSSNGTIIGGSVLAGDGGTGVGLTFGASEGLLLASSTISGSNTAISLAAGNTGRIEMATNTVYGGNYGLDIGSPDITAGELAITSMTFRTMSSGGIAMNFTGGVIIATFTAVRFDSPDLLYNMDVLALSGGSAITMRNPGGIRSGPAYTSDMFSYVYWPGYQALPAECPTGLSVKQDGTADNTTIQAALDTLSHNMTSDACVVIRDDGTYNEQIVVQGFTNNGYRLKIMADPTFISSAPVIAKDLLVYSASVTVHHLDFVPAEIIGRAIYASGPSIYISSVNVNDSGGKINGVGVNFISSGGELANSTVAVQNMIAVSLEGASFTAMRGSTLINNSDGYTTLYAYGSSSNTVSDCRIINVQGNAARIMTGSDYNTVVRSTFSSNQANRAALYLAGNKWNTVTNSYITNPAGYGAQLDSGAENNTISYSTLTVSNGGYSALNINAASSNTVSDSYVYNSAGYGAYLGAAAGYNTISRSTVATGGGVYAITLSNASNNTFEDDLFSAPAGYALSFISGSHYNDIARSILASNGTSMRALYMNGASSNTVTESVISHPSGSAAVINGDSVNNTISRSTMTCAHSAFRALELSGASSNTVSGSYIYNSAGYAAQIFGGANNNTISRSTIASDASGMAALNIYSASSNTVADSYIAGPYGNGADYSSAASYNTLIRSTITAGSEAFHVVGTSSNTVLDSYLQGQMAATLNGSTGTAIGGSVLVSTWTESAALVLTGGHGAMTISSSTVSGQTAVYFDSYNHGRLAFSSVTIYGLAYGVYFTTQSADAVIDIDSMTFASLSPGATAMVFAGGQFVSTFTQVAFNDSGMSVNVDGTGLYPGSMVRIASYAGVKSGVVYESDPSGYIQWGSAPGIVPVSAGSVSTGSIILEWSSPGADGDSGTLYNSSFTIQYTSVTVDAQNALFWSTAAAQVTLPVDGVAQGTAESYLFDSLLVNTSYYFRVWTMDDEQNLSEPSAVTPIVTMIEEPAGVFFHSITTASIAAEADGPGFTNLYMGQSDTSLAISTDAAAWTWAGWLAGERSTFTALAPNTQYSFRAKARNQAGVETAYSPDISTYTLAAVALPQGGTPLFSAVQFSSVTVNWSSGTAASGFNGAGASYLIDISTMSDFSVSYASATNTGLRLTSLNLLPNTTQYYRAQAYNSVSVSDYSWLELGEISTLADAPSGSQAEAVFFTSAAVFWTPLFDSPPSASGEGYRVEASTADDFSGTVLYSSTPVNAQAALMVEGLSADSTYYFRVGSLNWVGAPNYAAAFSTVTPDNIPPAAVNDLSAGAVAGDTVDLYWTSAGDNGADAALPYGSRYLIQYSTYAVEWSTAAAGLVTVSTGGVQPGEAQHYSLNGLSGNTTYYFSLWTVDEAGNYGPASNEASTLMLPNPVTSPEYLTVYQTNLTIAWVTAGNLPGTQYFAETSADAAFTLNTLSTVTTASNYTFNNLIPNTVYFARVKTLGTAGVDSEYVSFGSTVTLANPIAAPQVAAVYVASATVSWDANSNPEGTFYDIAVSSDDFASFNYSTTTDQTYFDFTGLAPNSTYYFRASAINADGLKSAQVMFPSTGTYAAVPAKHSTSFPAVSASSVTVQWLANGNPGYTQYYVGVSTGADFSGTDAGPGSWTAATTIIVSPLNPYATYYFRAKAKDFAGRETAYTELGSTRTLSGTDVIAPTVTDLQGGDDTWRGGASGSYKVYFADYASGLSRFQVRITTAQNAGGTLVADWTDVVTNIFAQTYSSDWQLPPSVFQNIPENTTSYVSVRVYDNSANVAVSTDVFYVRRDVTLPGITNNTVSTVTWIAADPGPIYDVDFADALSGLRYIQYSVSSQAGSASANILGWMDIAAVSSAPDYTADWGVNFNGLADAVTNYISVRAIDTAGNIRTTVDAFRILKNIKGPLVAITSPNTAYVSTITAVAGSATKRIDIAPVEGNELALLRAADALYWDGAGFNSASQFWLAAAGVDTWSVDVSTFGLVENSSYTAVARSRDINGKYSAVYATFTFTIDAAAPAVYLSTPTAGTTIYAFTLVEGTAADPQPGSGVSAVEISVQRVVDGKWWNFMTSAWGEAVVSSRAVGGSSWRFYPDNALKGNAISGQSYFVTAQAKDAAQPANASPFGLAGSTFTILDAAPPGQVTQISASSGTSPGRILLSWIASGDDGSAVMLGPGSQFAIQYATYPSVALSTALAQVLVSTQNVMPGSTQYHQVTGLVPSVTYYLALWTQDDAGLWSDASPLVSAVSGESLNDQITGHVRMPSGTGITGVLVEAFDLFGSAPLTVYTANDGLGTFAFTGIDDGLYRIQATWLANDLASTVSKDQIPMGYADVDFILSTEYELASISGTVPETVSAVAQTKGKTVSAADGAIELYQGSRRIAVTRPDAVGNFSIRNLLPGTYTVHFPQSPGVKDITVTLKSGENAVVAPLGELLRKNSVYAYPNPARNLITFHLQSDVTTALRKVISIFGIDGKLVGEIKEDNAGWQPLTPGEYKFELNTSKLASGVYIYSVKVEDAATRSSKKILGKFAIVK